MNYSGMQQMEKEPLGGVPFEPARQPAVQKKGLKLRRQGESKLNLPALRAPVLDMNLSWSNKIRSLKSGFSGLLNWEIETSRN